MISLSHERTTCGCIVLFLHHQLPVILPVVSHCRNTISTTAQYPFLGFLSLLSSCLDVVADCFSLYRYILEHPSLSVVASLNYCLLLCVTYVVCYHEASLMSTTVIRTACASSVSAMKSVRPSTTSVMSRAGEPQGLSVMPLGSTRSDGSPRDDTTSVPIVFSHR